MLNTHKDHVPSNGLVDLNLHDPVILTGQLIDIPSVSHSEEHLADCVYTALHKLSFVEVSRYGNTIVAKTHFGKDNRVILAGHLDTVPEANNVPHTRTADTIAGLGAVDMKAGDAVFMHLAAELSEAKYDITYIFYDCEEVESQYNGLGKLYESDPTIFNAQLAIIGEPSNGNIEAGCQGSLRGVIRAHGVRAHSARSWLGDNAIHHLGPIIQVCNEYQGRMVTIDDCHYREGLNIVGMQGGVAGNVIPDLAELHYNFRFAPDRDSAMAREFIEKLFTPHLSHNDELIITDVAQGARPLLQSPLAQELIRCAGSEVRAKHGWTDVARFAALGIPAVNFGPGDPMLAHKPHEFVSIDQITAMCAILKSFFTQ